MGKPSEIVTCVDCQEVSPRKELNRMLRCPQCAWAAVWENCHQLHEHQGPWYEKWKKAMLAKIDRIKAGVERS